MTKLLNWFIFSFNTATYLFKKSRYLLVKYFRNNLQLMSITWRPILLLQGSGFFNHFTSFWINIFHFSVLVYWFFTAAFHKKTEFMFKKILFKPLFINDSHMFIFWKTLQIHIQSFIKGCNPNVTEQII